MANDDVIKMRRFINEFQFATGGNRLLSNLPDPAFIRFNEDVHIPRKSLVQFRNNYLLLASFAALMCGTTIEKLCDLDLMGPFLRIAMEESEAREPSSGGSNGA